MTEAEYLAVCEVFAAIAAKMEANGELWGE